MKTKTLLSLLIMLGSLFVMSAVMTGAQDIPPRLWLTPEAVEAQPGQEFTVTINIAEAVGVYGASFKLAYDPQVLDVVITDNKVIAPGDLFEGQPSFTLKNSANVQEGIIEYSLTLTRPAEPVTGAGVLGTLTFRALTQASVSLTPLEGRLLSPEFTEVDGQMVAQRINEVDASMQGATLSISPNAVADPQIAAISAPAVVPLTSGGQEQVIVLSKGDVLVLAAASVFFLAGLVLFAMTVGMYSRMSTRPASRRSGQYV
jgi:hypothetical protein